MNGQPKLIKIWLPLGVLLIIATLEFVLLLRHKSPYVSDSYFYNHIFYTFQGNNFDQARQKILNKLDNNKLSDIEKNIFYNTDQYHYSLSRYIRRPLYPFTAYLLNIFIRNEYLSFIIPVFLSYIGVITLTYILLRNRFDSFWASVGTALFIGFYPFIDWSSYFLTDTIGAFFWLAQIYLILKYLQKPKSIILNSFVLLLIISLFNREQSILMIATVGLIIIIGRFFALDKKIHSPLNKIFLSSGLISTIFLAANAILKQPSLYNSWIYLQSNFGLYSTHYSYLQTTVFLSDQQIALHLGLLMDLIRHRWWATITALGIIGFAQIFIIFKKPKLLDIIVLASSISAYIGLIIIPFLSYRYFYPTIIGVIFFAVHALRFFSGYKRA